MKKLLSTIVAITILAGGGIIAYSQFHILPCSQPIHYALGQFDSQFKITQGEFLLDVQTAAEIWTQAGGRQFFIYDPSGAMKINLVYDTRQETTNKLNSLGINIEDTKASYDQLKLRYEAMKSDYNLAKQAFDAEVTAYQKNQNEYNQQVNYWNSHGGAPKPTYDELTAQKKELDAERTKIIADQNNLNQQVANLNTVIDALNQLGKKLNLNIATYNNIGTSQGSEFEEGVYVRDDNGRHIDIFEFDNQNQLIRLLAHELGHSLGLQHIDDPSAIMYRLNSSTNQTATPNDVAELKRVCKIP